MILFWFGSGPIKGFATTLMIGIATSLFTAIFISRLVISWRLDRNKDISFWTNWSKNIFSNTNIDFMGKRKMFYIISIVLIAVSIGSMATKGFNWGVDFTGGRTYVAEFDNAVDVDQVRSAMEPVVKTEAGRQYTMNVKTYGGDKRLKITTNYLIEDPILGSDSIVQARISDGLAKVGPFHFADETRKVDPTISDDIVKGAITSVLISLVFMFIYIAIRFKNWQYGAGALLSLMHDTIIVLGLYSLLWGIVGFSLEIDEAFIAVILTVIGYSINDTVVVFDRIREYLTDHKREGVVQVFNKAMNLTLSRTLMTGLNVMIVLLIIFFMGSAAIKGFVFGLFVGIVVGTYSSIFVASAVAVDFLKRKEEKQVALAA
ncbi:MAG: protein translocase subunit SecF [Flavobacteriales bacterium]|nr:protein translocase subunit SecF [Flavobacteriales bacterium]